MIRSRNHIAIPPGATIKEQLEDRGMTQKEFAARMNMSEKHISRLINGEVQLTPEMAYRLEMVLGMAARFWSNLEANYREELVKVEAENDMDEEKELAKKFPYTEMAKNGWVPETRSSVERVINLRKHFEVVRLQQLSNVKLLPGIACRRASITEKADYALLVWAQKAKLEARKSKTKPIDIQGLIAKVEVIRAMTTMNQADFCVRLTEILSDCGISLVFLPHIGGSFLQGATFYDKNKIVMGLTVRGKDADIFWFSLFHELGHVVLGHLNQEEGTDEADEKDADIFAQDKLIPKSEFSAFVSKHNFSRASITSFAEQIGIAAGIVVGRLQKDGYIDFRTCNDLKVKYSLPA